MAGLRLLSAGRDAVGSGGVDAECDDEMNGKPDVEALTDIDHVEHEEPGQDEPKDEVDDQRHGETKLLVPGEEKGDARKEQREDEEPERKHRVGEDHDRLGTEQGKQGQRGLKQGVNQGVLLMANWRRRGRGANAEIWTRRVGCADGPREMLRSEKTPCLGLAGKAATTEGL